MVEQALHCLDEADTFAAVEFLNQQEDPLIVAGAYNDLVKALYWQKKAIAQMVAIGRAGIQYCSDQAEKAAASDMQLAQVLRSAAKQLAYNLASFTWPGWNEPGINLQPLEIEAGQDAARLNLRLALELDKGDLPLSRAYWMLGAHLLAAGAAQGAATNFQRAAMYARRADSPLEEASAKAFAALANLRSAAEQSAYNAARERLLAFEEGQALAAQLDHARRLLVIP